MKQSLLTKTKAFMISALYIFALVFLFSTFLFNSNLNATVTGWQKENGEYVYYVNGLIKSDSIVESAGNTFYLDKNGHILKNCVFEYESDLYHACENGALERDRFFTVTDDMSKEWLVPAGTYYFQQNGKAYKRTNDKITKKIDGQYYIFDENGVMLIGWIDSNGDPITDTSSSLTAGEYFALDSGVLLCNKWYDFSKDLSYYDTEEENSIINKVIYGELEKLWLYFDKKCKKVKAIDSKRKTKSINGKTYAFDENGVMLTKMTAVLNIDKSQQSNPKINASVEIFGNEADGSLQKNQWLWLYPTSEMDSDEYTNQEFSWWRTDNNGKMIKNRIKEINGKKYAFDGLGRMKAGFVLINNGEYVANYQKEDLSSTDFIFDYEKSHLYGYELSDIHYFGDDKEKDGSQKTGHIQIELADGIKTFAFRKSGVCIGARGKLTKNGNSYYINGLRLDPKEDTKNGLVCLGTPSEINREYKVVGTNGSISKARNKVIRDEDDHYMLVNNGTLLRYLTNDDLPTQNCTIKYWKGGTVVDDDDEKITYEAGFYFYDNDKDASKNRYHYGQIDTSSIYLPEEDFEKLPDSLKINF